MTFLARPARERPARDREKTDEAVRTRLAFALAPEAEAALGALGRGGSDGSIASGATQIDLLVVAREGSPRHQESHSRARPHEPRYGLERRGAVGIRHPQLEAARSLLSRDLTGHDAEIHPCLHEPIGEGNELARIRARGEDVCVRKRPIGVAGRGYECRVPVGPFVDVSILENASTIGAAGHLGPIFFLAVDTDADMHGGNHTFE